MALPQINETASFVKIDLLSGNSIGVKPWRVKEEKELLFATESSEDVESRHNEIIKFIKRCVDNNQVFEEASNNDILKIAIELRKLSKGDDIDFNYKCSNCQERNEVSVKLSKNAKIKKFDFSPVKINEDLSFTLRDVPHDTMMKLFKDNDSSVVKFNYEYLLNSIKAITFKGELFTEFSKEEIIEFVDQLTSEQYETLVNSLNEKVSSITLEKKFKCIRCKTENEVFFGDLYDFLCF